MRTLHLPLAPFTLSLLLLFAAACSTKVSYVQLPGAPHIDPGSVFSVGTVTDGTGFVFPKGETEAFVLTDAMAESLRKALTNKGALGEGQWTVDVNMTEYKPGSAFARWLMPGMGETRLTVVAVVADRDGVPAARIPVSRSIAIGGAYTIGAWKYVFDEVAQAIAEQLTVLEKRAPASSASTSPSSPSPPSPASPPSPSPPAAAGQAAAGPDAAAPGPTAPEAAPGSAAPGDAAPEAADL